MWLHFIRTPSVCIGAFPLMFVVIWLTAWTLNAVKGTNFDLVSLRDMFMWLMTQLNATHAINSIWNSPRGSMPPGSGIFRQPED